MAVAGALGRILAKIATPAGAIVIGGKGGNTYYLDSMGDVAAVINLGGDNTFYDGTVSIHRPLLVNLNLGGATSTVPISPPCRPAPISGVSMIVNAEGGNHYDAEDMAQASAIGGVGIIVEFGGKTSIGADNAVQPRPSAAWHHRQPRPRQQLPCRHVGTGTRRPARIRHHRRHRRP